MAIKRLSRSAGLAVPTNIPNTNSGNSTLSTTDNVLWLNSKQNILVYTFTFIVNVQYHSNQYSMHISRAKELLQRSKLGGEGNTAIQEANPTHRNLQAVVDSEEVTKALEELTKAEEEEVTFTLPDSLAMNVADYISNVPDAMEIMSDINNYTHSLC